MRHMITFIILDVAIYDINGTFLMNFIQIRMAHVTIFSKFG